MRSLFSKSQRSKHLFSQNGLDLLQRFEVARPRPVLLEGSQRCNSLRHIYGYVFSKRINEGSHLWLLRNGREFFKSINLSERNFCIYFIESKKFTSFISSDERGGENFGSGASPSSHQGSAESGVKSSALSTFTRKYSSRDAKILLPESQAEEDAKTEEFLKKMFTSGAIFDFLERSKRFENAEHVFHYDYDTENDPEGDLEYEERPEDDPDYDPEGGSFDLSQLKHDVRSAFEPDDRPRADNPLPRPFSIMEVHEVSKMGDKMKEAAYQLGDYDASVAEQCIKLVNVFLQKNRVEEVMPYCKHLYKIFITDPFMPDPGFKLRESAGEALLDFADLLMRLKRREDALLWALNAQELLVSIPEDSHEVAVLRIAADTMVGFGFVWVLRHDMAEKAFRSALMRQVEHFGENHLFTALGQFNLGKALFKNGKLEEAADLLRKCRETRIAEVGEEDHSTRIATETLMEITSKLGLLEEALELFTNFEGLGTLKDWVPEKEPVRKKKEKMKYSRWRRKHSREEEEEEYEEEESEGGYYDNFGGDGAEEGTRVSRFGDVHGDERFGAGAIYEDDVRINKEGWGEEAESRWRMDDESGDAEGEPRGIRKGEPEYTEGARFETKSNFKLDLDLFKGEYSFEEVDDEEFNQALEKKQITKDEGESDGIKSIIGDIVAREEEGKEWTGGRRWRKPSVKKGGRRQRR